jgi:hypothetical protein
MVHLDRTRDGEQQSRIGCGIDGVEISCACGNTLKRMQNTCSLVDIL